MVTADDVTVRGNIVRNARDSYAVNISGHFDQGASGQTKRITIEGNLFEDAPRGILVTRGVAERLTIRRNTAPRITHSLLYFDGLDATGQPIGGVFTPTTIEGNVLRSGSYGLMGTSHGTGAAALAWWSGGVYAMTGNVIEKTTERSIAWPAGQTLLAPGALATLLDPTTFKHPDSTLGY